jgi:hypothetical protein
MPFQNGPDSAIEATNEVVVIHGNQQRILEHIILCLKYCLLKCYVSA